MSKKPTTPDDVKVAQLRDNVVPLRESEEKVPATTSEMDKGELITMLTVFGLGVGATVWAIVSGAREEKRLREEGERKIAEKKRLRQELEDWITAQENDNKKVYKLADGRYLTVDFGANQELHVKNT